MAELEATVRRQIEHIMFDVRREPDGIKVVVQVQGDGPQPLAEFDCDAQDMQALKQLLVRHEVLEAQ